MTVTTSTVRIPPVLRDATGGEREVPASGSTVRELLEDLTARLPSLGERIYDGDLKPFVNVYVAGEDVRTRGGLDAIGMEFRFILSTPQGMKRGRNRVKNFNEEDLRLADYGYSAKLELAIAIKTRSPAARSQANTPRCRRRADKGDVCR